MPTVIEPERDEQIRAVLRRLQALEGRVSALESENSWLRRQTEACISQLSRWQGQMDAAGEIGPSERLGRALARAG